MPHEKSQYSVRYLLDVLHKPTEYSAVFILGCASELLFQSSLGLNESVTVRDKSRASVPLLRPCLEDGGMQLKTMRVCTAALLVIASFAGAGTLPKLAAGTGVCDLCSC